MITKIITLALVNLIILAAGNKWECADYYWRDYHGFIPNDAIPAGKDKHNDDIYIGLVYIRGFEYLPATIYPKQKTATTTAYAHVLNTSQHVKILCGPYPESFQWLSIQSKDLNDAVAHRNLIPGGSEVGESLYIGRVFRNDAAIIGKIFRHERDNRGIWFPLGNGPSSSVNYEILSYDCAKNPLLPIFDLRSSADKTPAAA